MAKPVVLRFLGDTTSLDKALKRVQEETAKTGGFLEGMTKFSRGMVSVGRNLSTYITAPVIGLGFAAAKLATDFQASMAKVQGLTGASASQVRTWSAQILNLSKQLPESPKALADALYFIASAGFKGSAAMNVLTASAKASAAGLGDLPTVADAVTSALNAYGMKALSAQQATDVLVGTVREGKMPASELAGALGKVISPAQILGVRFDEVGAAIASMTHLGLNSFEATTALRGIFMALEKPAKGVQKTLAGIGLSAEGLRKEIREKGLLATLQTMAEKAHYNASTFAHMIPNTRALTGFMSMMKRTNTQTADIFGRLAHATGATSHAFAVASQTAKFKFGVALNQLKVVGIQTGAQLLPYLIKLAGWVSHLATAFGKLSPHTRKLIIDAALMAAAIGPVIFVLGKLSLGLSAIAKHPIIAILVLTATAFIYLWQHSEKFRNGVRAVGHALQQTGHFIAQHKTLLTSLGIALGTFSGVFGLIAGRGFIAGKAIFGFIRILSHVGRVLLILRRGIMMISTAFRVLGMAFAMNPIGAVITLIVALGLAFWYAYKHSATFRKWVQTALKAVEHYALIAWHAMEAFGKGVAKVAVAVGRWFAQMWHDVYTGFLEPIGRFFVATWHVLETVTKFAWTAIKWSILLPLGIAIALVRISVKALAAFLTPIWHAIVTVAKAVWNGLVTTFRVVWHAIWAIYHPIVMAIFRLWSFEIHAILTVGKAVLHAIEAAWSFTWGIVKAVAVAVWHFIYTVVKTQIDFVSRVIHDVLNTISSVWSTVWGAIKTVASTVWDSVKRLVSDALDALKTAIKGALDWISRIWSGIKHTIVDPVMNLASDLWDAAVHMIEGFINGILSMGGKIIGAIKNTITDNIPGFIKKQLGIHSPSVVFYELGRYTMAGFANGITDGQAGITRAVDASTQKLLTRYKEATIRVREALGHLRMVMEGHESGTGKHRHHVGPTTLEIFDARQNVARAKRSAAAIAAAIHHALAEQAALNKRRSAGKWMLGLAGSLSAGLQDALGFGAGPVESLATKLADTIKRQFADSHGKVPQAVAAAIANLKQLASKASSFRNDFISNLQGSNDITQALGGHPVGAADVKAFLATQLTKVKRFSHDLQILAKRGVPADFIRQIAKAGIDNGLSIADALANSSNADFQQILDLQKQLNAASTQAGNVAQAAAYGGGVSGALTKGAGLAGGDNRSITIDLTANSNADPKAIADEIVWALKTGGH